MLRLEKLGGSDLVVEAGHPCDDRHRRRSLGMVGNHSNGRLDKCAKAALHELFVEALIRGRQVKRLVRWVLSTLYPTLSRSP